MSARIKQLFPGRQLSLAGLAFAHLLLAITYVVSDSFTGSGFDESVIYFLHTGTAGLELSGYSYLIGSTLLLVLIGLFCCLKLATIPLLRQPRHGLRILALNLLLVALLFVQPVFNALATQPLYMMLIGPPPILVKAVVPGPVHLKSRKNLVYIYLESYERAFLDESRFPGLAPNLLHLQQQARSFTNIGNIYGTSWTIAGMVASQCGLPLSRLVILNTPGEFMSNAQCLGDIFKQHGYTNSYLGGAALRFAQKGNFYQTHGFDRVVGLEKHMEHMPIGTGAYARWGLYDDQLLKLARDELQQLASSQQAYAFFLLTLDTHPPGGYPSPECEGLQYRDGSNKMLNALKCTDHLVGNFVKELLASAVARNTIFVIASDHLMMKSDVSALLPPQEERRNLLLIIDETRVGQEIDKFGTTLDIAPTLLSLLGAETDAYYVGVNLLGSKKTLMESLENPTEELHRWSEAEREFY